LGPDGFAPGYALYGLGWIIAMEVEDRFRFRSARRLPTARAVDRATSESRNGANL
jgi:hypothetical protein